MPDVNFTFHVDRPFALSVSNIGVQGRDQKWAQMRANIIVVDGTA